MDDVDFSVLQRQAVEGDTDAMVDVAVELRARGNHARALDWLVRASSAGQTRGMAMLAHAYATGEGVERDDAQFLIWLHRAAENGDPGSMVSLAKAYRDGTAGLTKDPRQMLNWLLRAIQAGSSEAMRLLGLAYATGAGVPVSSSKSFTWYKRAAKAGDVGAMLKVADIYLKGEDTEHDPEAYFRWTKEAAEAGDVRAMFNLANAYDTGLGTEEDKFAFFFWIKKAAELEQPAALFSLAIAYRDGTGVRPDQEEYFRLLEHAANAGDPRALNNLAINYLYGFGVPVDRQKHLQLLKEAAEAREPNAMFNLAHAYRDGEGVAKDTAAYIAWLEEASKFKHPSAMVELAAHSLKVALADRTKPGAEQLARDLRFEQLAHQAADLGDGRAMYLLAMAHRLGIGAPNDAGAAYGWLERAAQTQLPEAMAELAIHYRNGTGYEKNDNAFFEWIRKAAEAGDAPAMTTLALAYHDGQGTDRNLAECRKWLERADALGEKRAFVLLGLLQLENERAIEAEALHLALKAFMGLQSEILLIKNAHAVREAPECVGYFTTFDSLMRMLPVGDQTNGVANRLRLYNAAYNADPAEGSRLLDAEAFPAARLLREFFTGDPGADKIPTMRWNGHEYSVYIGSFSLRNDHFDLWRTYGQKGEGYCVVTPLSAFPQHSDRLSFNLVHEAELTELGTLPEEWRSVPAALRAQIAENRRRKRFVKPALYRVEYDAAATAEVLDRLLPHLQAIATFKQSLKDGAAIVDALVRILMSDVLYLFKHEVYRPEQEARILVASDLASEYVKNDPSQQPSRLYVETEPFLFSESGSRIIIGPKVDDRTGVYLDLRYRLARNQWAGSTQVGFSSIPYR